jgi:hypothetical protein
LIRCAGGKPVGTEKFVAWPVVSFARKYAGQLQRQHGDRRGQGVGDQFGAVSVRQTDQHQVAGGAFDQSGAY